MDRSSQSEGSLEEWTERWLAETVHLKPKTRAGYDSLLRIHILPAFGKTPLGAIEPEDVSAWVAEMAEQGLSASRIRQAYRVLSGTLKAAVVSRYIVSSPCIGVRLPKPARREMLFLSADQVKTLGESTQDPFDVLVNVLAYGGLRWGEVAAVRRSRCDLLRSRIEVSESLAYVGGEFHFGPTKTYETRSVRLPPFLRDMMAQHLTTNVGPEPTALVFTQPDGGPLRHWWFWHRVWAPAVADAQLPEACESTTCGTHVQRFSSPREAHPKAIQVHLGHSTIQVTMDRYGHLFPDEMDRLAEGLDATFRAAAESRATAASQRSCVSLSAAQSESSPTPLGGRLPHESEGQPPDAGPVRHAAGAESLPCNSIRYYGIVIPLCQDAPQDESGGHPREGAHRLPGGAVRVAAPRGLPEAGAYGRIGACSARRLP